MDLKESFSTRKHTLSIRGDIMFPNAVRTGLTLSKVVGGISKTLNVANQIIPLYVQAKPIIQNARGALKIARELLASPQKEPIEITPQKIETTTPKTIQAETKKESISTFQTKGPIFFL